jgi:hypothetical protein
MHVTVVKETEASREAHLLEHGRLTIGRWPPLPVHLMLSYRQIPYIVKGPQHCTKDLL